MWTLLFLLDYVPSIIYARRQHFHHFRCQHLPFWCSLAMNVSFLSFSHCHCFFASHHFVHLFQSIVCVCLCTLWTFKLCTVFGFIDLRAFHTKENGSFKRLARKVLDTIPLPPPPLMTPKQFNRSRKPEDFTQEINDKMTSCVAFPFYTIIVINFCMQSKPHQCKPEEIPFA